MNKFKLFTFLMLISFFLISTNVFATHNRAGEITFTQKSALTFEIKLITYSDPASPADRDEIDIFFGDNTSATVQRSKRYILAQSNNIQYNEYVTTHTYPGDGVYLIQFFDPNRVAGIKNFTGSSVNIPFYVETELQINSLKGYNRSPKLLNPPIDFAARNQIFVHNPNAFDPDGDSLVFSLIPPKREKDTDVPYRLPKSKHKCEIDRFTGQFTWDYPQESGIYNIAILIEEYRKGVKIGYMIRDMQIVVSDKNNDPPVIEPQLDTCIVAGYGDTIFRKIVATDYNQQLITLTAEGGPFKVKKNKATFRPFNAQGKGVVSANFAWTVDCYHVRKSPYMVVFKAKDNHPVSPLADMKPFLIKVIGPEPQNLNAQATFGGIKINWSPPVCSQYVRAYNIYRKVDSSYWSPNRCEIGVPPHSGFKKIKQINGSNTNTFFDDDNGEGLSPGIRYCYRVTAIYLNKKENFEAVEGKASTEVCVKIKKDIPIITHVDVRTTDKKNGTIFVDWANPNPAELDTILFKAPYKYEIFRNNTKIKTIKANSFYQLTQDSSLIDKSLNTLQNQYEYKIFFYANTDSVGEIKFGNTKASTSVFLSIIPTNRKLDLSWQAKTAWQNYKYVIFKKNEQTLKFDSIGSTNETKFSDTNLINGKQYCYKVKSIGTFYSKNYPDSTVNFSQIKCKAPRDTTPPCPPYLEVNSFCDEFYNVLKWEVKDTNCYNEILGYNIYYSKLKTDSFYLIDTIRRRNIFFHKDVRLELNYSIAGCYVVTAIDSYMNESCHSNQICVDNCPFYDLPNIFTPNEDKINDLFVPLSKSRYIQKINIIIYNRWGQVVYQTDNPEINWDGKDQKTTEPCTDGVYYYICDVYEIYLEGNKVRKLKGTITIMR